MTIPSRLLKLGIKGRYVIKKADFYVAVATICSALCAGAAQAGEQALLTRFAKTTLASLQDGSFSNNREYCGMIGRTSAGELISTPARRGRTSGCNPRGFTDKSITPIASFHTHGAFHEMADAEVPSVSDLDADHYEGVLGFVSTPGGRLWMTDYRSKTVRQICGIGCLPKDPAFEVGMAGEIPKMLTRRELAQREGRGGPRHLRAHSHEVAEN